MTSEQAYFEAQQIVNRNMTNNNANLDKPRFVLLYNSIQTRYVEWILEKRNEDIIRYASPLLKKGEVIPLVSSADDSQSFKLPTDFFDHSNLRAYAIGPCGQVQLRTSEVKNDDIEELYHSADFEPSVEYADTFYHLASDNAVVYRKGFDISKVVLDYYRNPKEIDIEGYIKMDGSASTNIDPELSDKAVRRILHGLARQFASNNNDPQKYQLDKDTLFSVV